MEASRGRRVSSVGKLGTGLGLIDRMLSVGRALRARGHETLFLLKDVSRALLRFKWRVSRHIEQAGVGMLVKPDVAASDWRALLIRLIRPPQFAGAAQLLAQRRAGVSPRQAALAVVDRMEAAWGAP